MNRVRATLARLAAEISELSGQVADRVEIDIDAVLDRREALALKTPGMWSANRSCRLVQASDGWIAVNLPRPDDIRSVPAWLGCGLATDPWTAVRKTARRRPWRRLVAEARLLGLPVAGVGEIAAGSADPPMLRLAAGAARPRGALKVIDLSSMWAGPFAGAVLARAGAKVTKIESGGRPDALRQAAPEFFERLNGEKDESVVDFDAASDRTRLAYDIAAADVVITSARPRAFVQLGLTPETLFARNPRLTWIAVTGYGWMGEDADRVAFGDDAAAAGGLVRWTDAGAPQFMGDALADPLTGIAAAAGGLKSIRQGGGFLVDAALARTAAGVA